MALWVRQFGDICCRYALETEPQSTCLMHTHDTLELYYFLSGDCTYLIEGTAYRLRPHDLIFKRPLEAHKLIVNSSTIPYEPIGITLPLTLFDSVDDGSLFQAMTERPLGTNNRFTAEDFGHTLCTDIMTQILQRGATMTRTEFLSHIFLILTEADRVLREKGTVSKSESYTPSVATRLIDYTNEHLYTDITIQTLGEVFFLSYSQINRIFKRYTGSTAGQYIAAKRLLTARDRIRQGTTPADACYACGYNDYSAFYRAYTRYFGRSPKSDLNTSSTPHHDDE